MSDPASAPQRKPRRRKLAAGVVVAIVVGIVVATSVGRHPRAPQPPNPNGYDDFVRAGRIIHGDWPAKGDLAKAEIGEIRKFVEANQAALERARVGLGHVCLVPLNDSREAMDVHVEAISPIRSIGRLLLAEAKVAEADGRIGDALKSYLDQMALGQAVTEGGMGVDLMVGYAVQYGAIVGLRKLRDRLPREEMPATLRTLEVLDGKRVPPQAAEDQWFAWYQRANNPLMRAFFRWNGIEKSTRTAESSLVRTGHDMAARRLRFLLAELAIHAYHVDKQAWPRSLQDLVPAYLITVPTDEATHRPIDYPANEAGELTDDLAAIARPDGEVKPRP